MKEIIGKILHSLYPETNDEKENSRIYKIHKYWARKPWYIVEKYITSYSKPGELVMDPFCGSGCTGLEAVINGRNFKGQDLNPAALHVTKGTLLNNIDIKKMQKSLKIVSDKCKNEIMSLYLTEDVCEKCGEKKYYKYLCIGPKFSDNIEAVIYCPNCKTKSYKRTLNANEIAKLKNFNKIKINNWVPDVCFPKKFYKDRFSYKGISTVADMYTKRNLYALSLLYDAVSTLKGTEKELFMLAFTNTVLHVSKLKGENVRPLGVNNYWVPDDYIEENVWFRYEDRINNIITAKQQQNLRETQKKSEGLSYGTWAIENKSALDSMGENTVDYFFTDPPYGDAIQYSELSFVWNAWLKEKYDIEEEVIINPEQNKGNKEFNDLLCTSLNNIYAALKPERYFTLCFQNKNSIVWKNVVSHCKKLGLKLIDVSIYDTYGSPFNKSWANFSPKSDIYVTFQKSDKQNIKCYSKKENIVDIIKEIMAFTNEQKIALDNNRLYDLTISYLIWAMFLNTEDIAVDGFDTKKFAQMVQKIQIGDMPTQLEFTLCAC